VKAFQRTAWQRPPELRAIPRERAADACARMPAGTLEGRAVIGPHG